MKTTTWLFVYYAKLPLFHITAMENSDENSKESDNDKQSQIRIRIHLAVVQ